MTDPDQSMSLDGLESAWGLIANAWGGDWSLASPEWRAAAERWRDDVWHPAVYATSPDPTPDEGRYAAD